MTARQYPGGWVQSDRRPQLNADVNEHRTETMLVLGLTCVVAPALFSVAATLARRWARLRRRAVELRQRQEECLDEEFKHALTLIGSADPDDGND